MDPYTIACLSADPSWRSDDDPFTKEAMGLAKMIGMGAWNGIKAFGRGWKGMGALRKAENIERLATGTPWYKNLPFMPKTTPMSALSNPVYQNAHRAANIEKGIHQIGVDHSLAYRFGSMGRQGGAAVGAALTPLAYVQSGMGPVIGERQYAHGYTDASTRAMEEMSNTPWWKIMGLGLGKAFNKDILWDNVVDPVAGRGYWTGMKDGFNTKGIGGVWNESAKTYMAREMLRKRDQIRTLKSNPQYLQSVGDPQQIRSLLDELTAYRQAIFEAQNAQQPQS